MSQNQPNYQQPPQHHSSSANGNTSFDYVTELEKTLVEIDKAVKNLDMMAKTAQKYGLIDLIRSPGTFTQNTQNGLSNIMGQIDLNQISQILQSPAVRRMLTDPELLKLFAPDTGTTPGTSAQLSQTQNHSSQRRQRQT